MRNLRSLDCSLCIAYGGHGVDACNEPRALYLLEFNECRSDGAEKENRNLIYVVLLLGSYIATEAGKEYIPSLGSAT